MTPMQKLHLTFGLIEITSDSCEGSCGGRS